MKPSQMRGFACAVLLALAQPLFPQTATTGRIEGTVTDPSGARLAGAEVRLTGANGLIRATQTNEAGLYLFALLPAGSYDVAASAAGLQALNIRRVKVNITETVRVDFQLRMGTRSDQLTVTADPALIQRDSAATGLVIQQRLIQQLPLPTRNFQQLLTLTAGTANAVPNASDLGRGDTVFSVNGQRTTSNAFVINGVDSSNISTGGSLFIAVPAADTLQEFIVQTSLYDASVGRNAGGAITAVTRPGTDDLHGSAYYFLRRTALNANDFFLKRSGIQRPRLDRDQFGATLGGPLLRNRAWFFVAYQGTREENGAALRNSLTTVFVPENLTSDRSSTAINILAQQFGVPVVPGLLPHPTAVALLQATLPDGSLLIPPAPSPRDCDVLLGDPCDFRPVPLSTPSKFSEDQFTTNLDLQLAPANRFAARFFFANNVLDQGLYSLAGLQNALQLPGFAAHIPIRNRLLALSDTHVLRPTLLNDARFGYNRFRALSLPEEPFRAADFGIASPNSGRFPGLPTITLSNLFDIGSSPLADSDFDVTTYHIADTVSWTRGRHVLRLGGEFRHHRFEVLLNAYTRGQLLFTGVPALGGNPFRDFLFGAVAVSIVGSGDNERSLRANDTALFLADDWHLHPRLTLNLGIRFEYFAPFTERQGRLVSLDPRLISTVPISPGLVAVTGGFVQAANAAQPLPGIPRVENGLTPSDRNNFAPRVGFSWQPLAGSGGLVVRGGYGVYFDRPNARATANQVLSFPYYLLAMGVGNPLATPFVQVPSPTDFPLNVTDPALFPFGGPPAVLPGGVGGLVPANGVFLNRERFRTPYVQQYNLGMQWEFMRGWMLDFGYVGSVGRKLTRLRSANQMAGPGMSFTGHLSPGLSDLAVPGFGVHLMETSSNSSYNSLQAGLTHRFSRGLGLLASYTWSHSSDDYSGAESGVNDVTVVAGDQVHLNNRAVSDFDRRHRLVTSAVYELPRLYRGQASAARLFLNEWQVSGILTLQSGTAFSVVTNANPFNFARADFAPGFATADAALHGPVDQRLEEYFNTAAFTAAMSAGEFGNTPRNLLRGPNQQNVDLAVVKTFPVSETGKVEFRAEFFNLFNFVNFANPVNVQQAPNFGQIVRTSTSPRVVQIGLRFSF